MSFRFRRSIKLLPGIKLNIGTRGPSITTGVPGTHITMGGSSTRATVGLPGTGMSYTETIGRTGRGKARGSVPVIAICSAAISILFGVLKMNDKPRHEKSSRSHEGDNKKLRFNRRIIL